MSKQVNVPDKTSEVDKFDYVTQYYYLSQLNEKGDREVTILNEDGKAAGAKSIVNQYTNNERYFLKAVGATLFNPNNLDHLNSHRFDWKFVKVPKATFETYLKFLKTGSKAFLTQAERLM